MKRLLAIAAFALLAAPAFSQTLTYTVETTTSDGKTLLPRLTWLTTPAAASCTASNGWTGSKAAAGTELLAAISTSASYRLLCTWPGDLLATVFWTAPTTNDDGSALTDLAGFRIYYGTSATALTQTVTVADKAAVSWKFAAPLTAGKWFFGVRAFNVAGIESVTSSPLATKTLTAGASIDRTLEVSIKFPSAPGNVTAN